jgi:Glycosyl transferase family 2
MMSVPETSLLSVVVVIVSDTIERRAGVGNLAVCLEALSNQVDAPPLEVIVPHHPETDGIEDLRKRFPHVMFIAVADLQTSSHTGGSREHHDVLRARGLTAAHGDVIGLLEDHGRPDEHWCANVVAAHRGNYAAIGGAIENGIDRPLNWAVYYCDFGKYQKPLPPGESSFASDANVTYKRSALETIRAIWEESFREVVVNGTLRSRGEKLMLQPDIVVYQNRRDLRLGTALRERFVWGRSYAATRSALLRARERVVYAALSPLLPLILLLRMAGTAWKRRRHFAKFLRALPLTVVLVTVWSIGEGVGYATAR